MLLNKGIFTIAYMVEHCCNVTHYDPENMIPALIFQCIYFQGIFTIACMVEHSCIPTGHRCFNSDMSITVS